MNKILHGVILVVFDGACWFLSLMLKLPLMYQTMAARSLALPPGQSVVPLFTRYCMAAGPYLLAGLAITALSYCVYVWVSKSERPRPWVGFLATTMSALVLAVLPTVVAMYLPVADFLNQTTAFHGK